MNIFAHCLRVLRHCPKLVNVVTTTNGCTRELLRSLFFSLSLDLILLILSVDLIRQRSSPFLNLTSYQTLILYSDLITQLPTCDYHAFTLIPLRSHRHVSTLHHTCIYLTLIAQSPTCDYLVLHML